MNPIARRFVYLKQTILNQMAPETTALDDSLLYWRLRIFLIILMLGLAFSTIAVVVSVFIAISSGNWMLIVFDFAGFCLSAFLLFAKKLSYKVRAFIILALFYLIGVWVILLVGPLSGGPFWLFGFAVLVGVLLGAKPAIWAVGLNMVTFSAILCIINAGWYGQEFPFYPTTSNMVGAILNFLLVNGIATFSVTVLVRGMISMHEKEKDLSVNLEQDRNALWAAKKRLESEIAERKLAQEKALQLSDQLQRAKKMEALGQLAGGVAHDLNNVLSGLTTLPELLLLDLAEDSDLKEPLENIMSSGAKAAAIVKDLLALARRGVAVTEIIAVNEVVHSYLMSAEYQRLMRDAHDVVVETDLADDLLNITGAKAHILKTIMNLLHNAVEAMPDGGRIIVKTENRYVDFPIGRYDRIEEGDYVVVSIKDTGVGIEPHDLGHIFEPFYTNKKMGRSGTGLGLSVVWGTVKDLGGYIDVNSIMGQGTQFILYLPGTRKPVSEDTQNASWKNFRGRGESILVVDDVPQQTDIAARILSVLGYRSETVESGEKAVAFLEKQAVDLVILDMIMPGGMDGLETYQKILAVRPRQKAIIASGFSETGRVKEAMELGVAGYIAKPYTIEKLGQAIRQGLMDRKNPAVLLDDHAD